MGRECIMIGALRIFCRSPVFFAVLEIKEGFWPGYREYIIVGIIKGTGDWREEIFQ